MINHNGKEYFREEHKTSLVVQWLRLHASTAGDMSSIPGWGSSACHECGQEKIMKVNKNVYMCLTESLCRTAEVGTTLCESATLQ